MVVQDMKEDLAWSLLCGLRDVVMYRKAVPRSFMLLTKKADSLSPGRKLGEIILLTNLIGVLEKPAAARELRHPLS